ncbi:MAG: polysaccharide deacetylase family protein [Actinomycetota bacterium]|nr:polysaccharide deacetylase family protein [Actinomycetota bacterium]
MPASAVRRRPIDLRRREFLAALALGAASALAGCTTASPMPRRPRTTSFSPPPHIPPPRPGRTSSFTHGPAHTAEIALTIDDGYDADTVAAYVKLAHDTGLPLTFNPIGKLAHIWQPHAPLLRPLIEKNQIQIANHTYNHLLLPELSDAEVTSEIEQNEAWIESTFGVTARPYLRPPSGQRDRRVDTIAGNLGFTKIVLWQGTFGDAVPVTPDHLLALARQALVPGSIVVGHANQGTVTSLYPQLVEIIRERKLVPVTLDAMFGTSRAAGA